MTAPVLRAPNATATVSRAPNATAPRAADARPRTGEWLEDPGFGVYVHVPFCLHRCHYCDFNAYAGEDELHDAYVDALVRSIAACDAPARPATSVFFGGGTPTLLPPARLGAVLRAVRDRVGVVPGAEVTVEANPETVDEAAFEALLEAGFNRVSIGVQSTSERVLRALGRTHSVRGALDALRAARRAGVPDVNADLIFGSPWEGPAEWRESLARVVDAGCDHVSAYALTVEEGTPLHTLVATGRAPDVDPDVQAERHGVACDVLAAAGYARYEVSNWARPGRASAHNVLYWSAGDYLGFGAGAHGHVAGRRSWTVRLPRRFVAAVAAGEPVEEDSEVLDDDARAGEALVLGLRLAGGVDVAAFGRRFGAATLERRSEALRRLAAAGLVDASETRLRLAPAATLVANDVFAALL